MKKLVSIALACLIVFMSSMSGFAMTPSKTFKNTSEILGFQSFMFNYGEAYNPNSMIYLKISATSCTWYKREFGTLTFKKIVKPMKLTLSKDKKFVLMKFTGPTLEEINNNSYNFNNKEELPDLTFAKDKKGLLYASPNEYFDPVTKYKNEADLLKVAKKNKYELTNYNEELVTMKENEVAAAREKLALTEPLSDTNKLNGSFESLDKKWNLIIIDRPDSTDYAHKGISLSNGVDYFSYDMTKMVNKVGKDGLVTTVYQVNLIDGMTGVGEATVITIVSKSAQKIVSIHIANMSPEMNEIMSKMEFNFLSF